MKDIAAAAGVSQSTVSRVLNNAASPVPITERTRERVIAAARDLGYRPNPLARALRGAPTMLLGVVVRDITDPFFAGAIEALSAVARARAYNLVLGHAHGSADEAIVLAAVLEARHCDAIVVLGDMRDQPRLIEDLRGAHVPVVAVWQGSQIPLIPSVRVDNRAAIVEALDHLSSLGHRRIAFVGGRMLGDVRERHAAFVSHVRSLGYDLPDGYVRRVPNTPAGGEAALRGLMALSDPPTAVMTSTDVLAIGVLHAAAARGLSVPADLSVVGFDDLALAAYTVPALTTLRMPVAEMVEAAFEIAIGAGAANGARAPADLFRATLVTRGSTAPPRSERPA